MGRDLDRPAFWVNRAGPFPWKRGRTAGNDLAQRAAPERSTVLANLDPRAVQEGRGAEEHAPAHRRRVIGDGVGRDPRQWRQARDMYSRGPIALPEPKCNGGRRVLSGQCGDVRRLRALNDVARSKDARVRRPVSSIDAWAARSRVELDAALHGELMVGNPIAGEDNRVTRDLSRPACVQLEQV